MSVFLFRFLFDRLTFNSVVKMPLDAADFETDNGFATSLGGKSKLDASQHTALTLKSEKKTCVELSTMPLRVCLCGIASAGIEVLDGSGSGSGIATYCTCCRCIVL